MAANAANVAAPCPMPALVEEEHEEGGDRGEADDAEREHRARPQRLARDQRRRSPVPAAGVKRSGIRIAIRAPSSGRPGGERPDELEARRVQQQLADRGAEAEAAPDRQPVEADQPAAALGRREVDDPGRARGEDHALAGAEEQPGDDQARHAGGDEVQEAGRPRSAGLP